MGMDTLFNGCMELKRYHDLVEGYHEACSMRMGRYRFTIYWNEAGGEEILELFEYGRLLCDA
jgi:hypothetical protein